MAKIIENPKGFKVIQIPQHEIVSKLGKHGAVGICDRCNQAHYIGYYVAVLNRWYCSECYSEWMETAIRYEEDVRYEDSNFETYKKLFTP